jgi:hypothetical protein
MTFITSLLCYIHDETFLSFSILLK